MSSDLFLFDSTVFTDQFSPFSDSSIDILQSIPNQENYEEYSLDQIATTLLSSSPPSHQLENLSISQTTHLGIQSNNGFLNYSVLEVKTEECQIPIYSSSTHEYYNQDSSSSFLPHSYGGGSDNTTVKMMQRSFSSNCFDGKPNYLYQPRFDSLMESSPASSFHSSAPQLLSSPENGFSSGQMRRVCSTGDLQNIKTSQRLSSSPLATESSFMEEANSKVGKYSAEERKERIHRYRAKRTQRNFNKTIKYACRKTLADNRPRIRGRFARNDEPGETPKASTFNRYEEDDELWGFHDEEEERRTNGRVPPLFSSSSYGTSHQFQYYGYS